MAIIIKRRDVTEKREPAPLVADASASPVVAKLEPTDAERLQRWQKRHPSIHAEPKQCKWCMKMYIVPCGEGAVAATCANYLYLRASGADKR